ncbi:Alpha/Beta hydrolase protein [Phakopsora pachyrhizi]|uniref:Alpha/Beta hydrolase protein n=1 Tax=Phakopsora pachyrhizi TaxID=170000 RepID=A0AAV0BGD0_PHAPC|nr:Alpha/Beta hydrolase protein [Phakopsora pachyrhizi]CAH7685427.1 Alpha/Beta hydrolase protein [Phakopsora pachyrhizi]
MLIIFQRRLIYLPYFPPNSKSQELDQYLDKGNLSIAKNYLLKGSSGPRLDGLIVRTADEIDLTGIIYYLQGNAGNTLARIPIFQTLLLQPSKSNPSSPTLSDLNLSIFALSPRGYWTSAGPLPFPFTPFSPPTSRFNQAGIVSDYRRGLEFIASQAEFAGLPIWVLGHSLGGAAAAQLLSTIDSRGLIGKNPIAGLVLENPLPSVKLMLKTIYPSKWMPYHHLGPFVKDEWDTIRAFRESRKIGKNTWLSQIPLMIIQSQMDELVPPSLTRLTYDAARDNRPDQSDSITRPRYIIIPHALHDTAYLKPKYIKEIYKFIKDTTPK